MENLGKRVFFGNLSKDDLLLEANILIQVGIEYYKNNDDEYLKENVNKKWLEICTKNDIIIYINHLKKKVKQNYIYFNDKEFRFFKAENDFEARHFVINNCDLSFNPAFLQVYDLEVINDNDKKKYRFNTKGELIGLRLKNFFNLFGSGEGAFCFFG